VRVACARVLFVCVCVCVGGGSECARARMYTPGQKFENSLKIDICRITYSNVSNNDFFLTIIL